jgi:hypothetical protein
MRTVAVMVETGIGESGRMVTRICQKGVKRHSLKSIHGTQRRQVDEGGECRRIGVKFEDRRRLCRADPMCP